MNRNFSNAGKIYAMHVSPVMVTTNIVIGASGAVTSFSQASLIASVVHTSTGVYTVTMQPQNNVNAVICPLASLQSPASGLSGVSTVEFGNAPSTTMAVSATPTIVMKCLSPAGTVVNPASGSTLSMMVICNNSSVKS